jgi:hypothetical protein
LQSLASLNAFSAYLDGIVQYQEEMKLAGIGAGTILLEENDDEVDTIASSKYRHTRPAVSFTRQLLDLLDGINNVDDGRDDDDDEEDEDRDRRHRFYRPRRRHLDPKSLLRRIGESNQQFRLRSFAMMEQQDAQELLVALLDVVISDAQLDTMVDRRFAHQVDQNIGTVEFHGGRYELHDEQQEQLFSYFDGVGSFYEEEDGQLMTSVMANINVSDQGRSSSAAAVSSLNKGTGGGNGLILEGEGNNVLSLSGLLHRIEQEQKQSLAEKNCDSLDVFSAVKPSFSQERRQLHSNGYLLQEEKKQEHFDDHLTFLKDPTLAMDRKKVIGNGILPPKNSSYPKACTSIQLMRSTISSITPSPLSGWLGSTLQCTRFAHVRPIQNAPFLDIPLVPTSVPNYLMNVYHSVSKLSPPNTCVLPSCSLEECLAEFTSVENVQGVECRSCTIRREEAHLEEEAMMLRGAVETMEKRTGQKRSAKNGVNLPDDTKYLREDLAKVEERLLQLRTMDWDEDDIGGSVNHSYGKEQDNSQISFGLDEESKMEIERCDARKCLLLTRTPSILCCHIQRRYYDPYTNRMEKCIQMVEIPEYLDLSPYCAYGPRAKTPWAAGSSSKNQKCSGQHRSHSNMDRRGKMVYRLQSVIEHRGNSYGGHYISYRRDHSGKWFQISDDSVIEVGWGFVRKCQAYMVFYEVV